MIAAAGHSGGGSTQGIATLSSCHWRLLKTHHHGSKSDGDHGNNRGQRSPRSRQRHSACRVGEFVYVFGGKDGTRALRDVWKYNIYNQTWEMVEIRGGSLPLLQGHTAVAYKRLIVIFGGTFNNNVNDIQLWIFNTDLGHLREVWGDPGTAQPLCRRDHSAVMHHNLMYMFGGFKDPTGACQELWAFNMDEEEWTELTHLSHCRPSGRYGHSAVVADNAMWIFGGTAGLSPCTDFWKYSFALHQWSRIKYLGTPPVSLSGHSTCVLHHQMIVVGGYCKGKPMNDIWTYRFDTNTWRKLTNTGMQLPGLSCHTCVSVSHTDHRNQPPADRALSTPHLKPPSSSTPGLLHPDRFVVRPRTSPSALEDPSTSQCEGDRVPEACVTQVMRLEEPTPVDSGVDTNSTHKTDTRIDVSLKEPLVSDSPQMAGFYDSCIPFSPRQDEEGWQELQVIGRDYADNRSESSGGGVSDRPSCPGENPHNKTVTVDLIDLSESPALKASKQSFESTAMIRKEITFWNDLFIEDLESSDEGGLDEVQISYPSQNPMLPPPPSPVINDCDGVETIEDASAQQWKNRGHQNLTNSNSLVLKGNAECRYSNRLMSDFARVDSLPQSTSAPCSSQWGRPLPHSQAADSRGGGDPSKPGASSDANQALAEHREVVVHSLMNQRSPVSEDRPTAPASNSNQEQKGQGRSKDSAETSFMDGCRDSAHSQRTSNSVVPLSSITTEKGKPSPADNFVVSGSVSGPAGSRSSVSGNCSAARLKVPEVCIKGEMELEEPFVLVLGGKTEEQISIHPKPIAVWKGMFV